MQKFMTLTIFVIGVFGVTANAQERPVIAEIIVTAQKTEESIQDVPISISAISEADLEQSGIKTPTDLQLYVPGLNISAISGQVSYTYIRGSGQNQFDPGSDPSVAYFVDEVYIQGNSSYQFDLIDAARVEVLKGPQGTLFGRNAAAGAINFVTQRPENESRAYVEVEVANENAFLVKALATGPLSDRSQYRLTAVQRQRDSYTRNLLPGVDDPDEVDQYGLRGALNIDLNEYASVLITAEYAKRDNGMTNQVPITPTGIAGLPGVPRPTAGEDLWNAYYDVDGHVEGDYSFLVGRLEWITPLGELTSITSYRSSDNDRLQDQDATSLDTMVIASVEDVDTFSQEIRLSRTGDRVSWIAGLYYFDSQTDSDIDFRLGGTSALAFIFGIPEFLSTDRHRLDVLSHAAFGQLTFHLGEAWDVTLGLRYSDDEKDSDRVYTSNVLPDYLADVSESWNSTDPMISIQYRPAEGTMLYGSVRTGFKSGGFQTLPSNQLKAETPFDEESVTAYEVGVKSDLLDGRMRANLALFRNEYEDQQISVIEGPALIFIRNAGETTADGLDLSLEFAVTERLTLRANYGYLDAAYDEFFNGSSDFAGNHVLRSPEHKFSFISDFSTNIGEFELDLRAEYHYSDRVFWDDANTETVSGVRFVEDPHYEVVGVRATLGSPSERWSLSLWGKNLTDEEYCYNRLISGTAANCVPAPPRTYGATVRWNFN